MPLDGFGWSAAFADNLMKLKYLAVSFGVSASGPPIMPSAARRRRRKSLQRNREPLPPGWCQLSSGLPDKITPHRIRSCSELQEHSPGRYRDDGQPDDQANDQANDQAERQAALP